MSELQRLPLFPLSAVLFPRSRMGLHVFEARYLDMIARCMQAESTFGICLIADGQEVGAPALVHGVGVEARIVDWDMSVPNLLGLTVRGQRRFHVLEQMADKQGLVTGIVRWFDEPAVTALPVEYEPLLPLLQMVVADAGEKIPLPHAFDDADWVGFRYAEILPIPPLARQRLLELEDPLLRLSIVQSFLKERGLLKPS
ncbi:MAG: peptidase S16 [Candidatus Dactylopiibacterium carminicum]|nr:MAG: peptidase S16 [Candidatus Dactylopiibacterium carminicum]